VRSPVLQYFKVPQVLQQRVLKWGLIGAALLRGAFIAAGLIAIEVGAADRCSCQPLPWRPFTYLVTLKCLDQLRYAVSLRLYLFLLPLLSLPLPLSFLPLPIPRHSRPPPPPPPSTSSVHNAPIAALSFFSPPQSFKGVLLIFAGLLIFSSYKILAGPRERKGDREGGSARECARENAR
jgi:hypothetical protein